MADVAIQNTAPRNHSTLNQRPVALGVASVLLDQCRRGHFLRFRCWLRRILGAR